MRSANGAPCAGLAMPVNHGGIQGRCDVPGWCQVGQRVLTVPKFGPWLRRARNWRSDRTIRPLWPFSLCSLASPLHEADGLSPVGRLPRLCRMAGILPTAAATSRRVGAAPGGSLPTPAPPSAAGLGWNQEARRDGRHRREATTARYRTDSVPVTAVDRTSDLCVHLLPMTMGPAAGSTRASLCPWG